MKRLLVIVVAGLASVTLAFGKGGGGGNSAPSAPAPAHAGNGGAAHGPVGGVGVGLPRSGGMPNGARGVGHPYGAPHVVIYNGVRTYVYPGVRSSAVHSMHHTGTGTTVHHNSTGSGSQSNHHHSGNKAGTHNASNLHAANAANRTGAGSRGGGGGGEGQTQTTGQSAANHHTNKSDISAPRHHPNGRKEQIDSQTANQLRHWNGKRDTFAEARQKQNNNHNHHHDHDWWHHHCPAIIWVDWGYWGWGWWGWDNGWWYPAYGYDPYYSNYEYDGPIYGYGGLTPTQVVVNVQTELQQAGYYTYAIDGVMGGLTETALGRYQSDNHLPVTNSIDAATLNSLGLIH